MRNRSAAAMVLSKITDSITTTLPLGQVATGWGQG